MTTITDPAIAAAHVAVEISEGDRFTLDIIVREDEFEGEASASHALENALIAMNARWPKSMAPARVDIAARSDIHGLTVDVDGLEIPDSPCVTVVVSLSSPFYLDRINSASVFGDVRRAIQDHEEATGLSVYRVIYLVSQESR